MTGIIASKLSSNLSEFASRSPALENKAARIFQQSQWLNDISLPLLLALAGSLANRPAEAQQEGELNDIVITAQNQFGTTSQLIVRDKTLYLLEAGCNLVMIRQLSPEDIAAIRALSLLSVEEVGLHLQLVSYAPITDSELSDFCVASDPVSSFVSRIRKDDGESSSIAGILAGGLGLLLGLAGGGGGVSGRANQSGITITDGGRSDFATLEDAATTSIDAPKVLNLTEGNHGSEDSDIATSISIAITNSDGSALPASDITLSDGNDDEEDDLFILKGNQLYIKAGAPEEGKTKFDFESNPSFDLTISGGGQTQTLKVNITDKILNEDEEITLSLAKRARDDEEAFAPIQITDKNHKVDELDDDYYFLIVSAENANNADLKSKFELTKTMNSGDVTARHLKLKTGQTLEDEATGDITIYVAANKFEIQLEADELQHTQIKSVAEITEGTSPQFPLTNPLETSPLEVEVGTDEYIVLKDDGTFEAVTQSDLDKLSAGRFAIVATLHTDISDIEDEGLIDTQQKTESDADYFTSTTELKKIDIELTDVALNLTVTKEMDESATNKGVNDILGHEKHEDDHVSYQEAEQAETANIRIVDLDGDTSDASDQIKGVDGVVIDLSATATDIEDTPVKYATKTTEDGNDVITLGANAGDLAAGDKLTSIENITGSGFVDVLIGDGSANTLNGEAGDDYLDGGTGDDTLDGGAGADRLTGGAGDDVFVLELSDGARGQDIVTDFTANSDKIQISLTQANITTINGEGNDADKLAKLLELANLSTANNADAGHTSTSNDASANDTVITYTASGASDVVMVLEDYSTALTFDDFALEVL